MLIKNITLHQVTRANWHWVTPTQDYIVLCVTKGAFIYHFAEQTVRVAKGELLYMPMGAQRTTEAEDGGQNNMYAVYFHSASLDMLEPFLDQPFQHVRPLNSDYMKQRFSMLYECWIGKMPRYKLIAHGIFLEMVGMMQRDLIGDAFGSSRHSLVMRIQQYIVKHHHETIRLSDLAREVDRTPSYVSTIFKDVTGRTPVEYMHEIRVAAARELLMTSTMSIREISESLGYCDQSYFNNTYKKIVGSPPSHTLKVKRD
ncbi:MAG: AraC family transcriptional regulator [Paenibacillus sp.]|nr:AraC family transcriptional regulator [Paenibacillus sp.]